MNTSTHSHGPQHRRAPILSSGQIDRILPFANQYSRWGVVHDLAEIFYRTGIHRMELADLLIADVDTAQNCINVVVATSRYGGRSVPLTPNVLAAITRLHSLNPNSKFVLGDKAGARLARASRDLRRIASQIGAGNVSPHALRVSFAARLAYSGVNLAMLARMMGYSSASTTSRLYFRNYGGD